MDGLERFMQGQIRQIYQDGMERLIEGIMLGQIRNFSGQKDVKLGN